MGTRQDAASGGEKGNRIRGHVRKDRRTDGGLPSPPVGFLPLHIRRCLYLSAPLPLCPSETQPVPLHPNVTFEPSPGMQAPIFNWAVDLFAQPARCWLQPWVALHVREPESRWVILAKWQSDMFLSDHCLSVAPPPLDAKTILGDLLTWKHLAISWPVSRLRKSRPDATEKRVKEDSESKAAHLWSELNCCCLATHQCRAVFR